MERRRCADENRMSGRDSHGVESNLKDIDRETAPSCLEPDLEAHNARWTPPDSEAN
jgi:hypothetical protein